MGGTTHNPQHNKRQKQNPSVASWGHWQHVIPNTTPCFTWQLLGCLATFVPKVAMRSMALFYLRFFVFYEYKRQRQTKVAKRGPQYAQRNVDHVDLIDYVDIYVLDYVDLYNHIDLNNHVDLYTYKLDHVDIYVLDPGDIRPQYAQRNVDHVDLNNYVDLNNCVDIYVLDYVHCIIHSIAYHQFAHIS